MKTSQQLNIKGDPKIRICVTLIILLHTTITIYLTFTEVKTTFKATKNIDQKIPKNTPKDKKREVWSKTNFQTLTRSKNQQKYGFEYFPCKNISTG